MHLILLSISLLFTNLVWQIALTCGELGFIEVVKIVIEIIALAFVARIVL